MLAAATSRTLLLRSSASASRVGAAIRNKSTFSYGSGYDASGSRTDVQCSKVGMMQDAALTRHYAVLCSQPSPTWA